MTTVQLKAARLDVDGPVESWTTPRRLAVRVHRVAERQTDLEEVLNGPPRVRRAWAPTASSTQAAIGFAKKNGVEPDALVEIETPKGRYLAVRKRQRGRGVSRRAARRHDGIAAQPGFPEVDELGRVARRRQGRLQVRASRALAALPLRRPCRPLRHPAGRGRGVAVGPGRPVGRDDLRPPLSHHQRTGRPRREGQDLRGLQSAPARELRRPRARGSAGADSVRELDVHAGRLGGRVHRAAAGQAGLLDEVPDLVEWPSVVAGVFPAEFLALPEEVLTTTMIHHQHYFPVVDEHGKLKAALLAVTNVEIDRPELISRNSERVLTARLRDAQFFWNADRKVPLEARIDRLDTILFHKKFGSYKAKAERARAPGRVGRSARRCKAAPKLRQQRRRAGWPRRTWALILVREFTELQGTMGGIYAREQGLPEAVWKAIYYHYLPVAVGAGGAADARAAGGRHDLLGRGVDCRQARHVGRVVFRGRASDGVARPPRPAPPGAWLVPYAGGSARAHRSFGETDRGRAHRGCRARSAA